MVKVKYRNNLYDVAINPNNDYSLAQESLGIYYTKQTGWSPSRIWSSYGVRDWSSCVGFYPVMKALSAQPNWSNYKTLGFSDQSDNSVDYWDNYSWRVSPSTLRIGTNGNPWARITGQSLYSLKNNYPRYGTGQTSACTYYTDNGNTGGRDYGQVWFYTTILKTHI